MNNVIFIFAMILTSQSFAAEKNTELNLEFANEIIKKAIICGQKNSWRLSIAIVNAEGNLINFQRTDGAFVGSIDASIAKASSANAFQRSTKVFADAVKDGRIGLLSVKNVIANEGGLPIVINGKHVGAIGISGAKSTEDEICAAKALE